jgi:hypothetical protein
VSTKSSTGRDDRPFEDVVLDLLLAVQDDLRRAPNSRATRAWSRGPEHGRTPLRRSGRSHLSQASRFIGENDGS